MGRKVVRFADWLERSGYTPSELALLCNVSRQAVYAWKNGESQPTLAKFHRLVIISKGELALDSFTDTTPSDADKA